jgi:anaerobic selenocysteine-containing dehydrogenase
MTYAQFQATGWYSWSIPNIDNPTVGMSAFYANPKSSPLTTPSGLIEISSSRVAKFYGPNDPLAPTVPKYIQAPESLSSAAATQYPLLLDAGPHPRRGRHSQWNDVSWQRDIDYDYIHGYRSMWMNPVDAAARNLNYGDIIRVFNSHGQGLFAAKISERVKPGVIWVAEGGHYTPRQPGVSGSIDLGGLGNVLLPGVQQEKISHGQVTHTLVQMEKWSGS